MQVGAPFISRSGDRTDRSLCFQERFVPAGGSASTTRRIGPELWGDRASLVTNTVAPGVGVSRVRQNSASGLANVEARHQPVLNAKDVTHHSFAQQLAAQVANR